jgi:hypothetical protein
MKQTTIQVEFGAKGWRECLNRSRKANGEIDPTKVAGHMFNYLIDGLMVELKNQGYRSIGRGRILFEEACDWQVKFNVNAIIEHRKQSGFKKVAKYVKFTIGDEIPKVE